jgi:hypothetical protein
VVVELVVCAAAVPAISATAAVAAIQVLVITNFSSNCR